MISEELTIDGNVINYLSYRLSYDYEAEVWDIVGSHGGIITQRKTLEQAVLFCKWSQRMKTSTVDKVKMRVQIKTALNMLENPEFMSLFEQWDKDDPELGARRETLTRGQTLERAKAALKSLKDELT